MAKITLEQWKERNRIQDEDELMEVLEDATFDGSCPALCDEGCDVEPDGHCPHGGESILLAMGMI